MSTEAGKTEELERTRKEVASSTIDQASDELSLLGRKIWENPELGFKELKAHEILTKFLEERGFQVDRSYARLETSFRASYGSGPPNVCVICEYDALPDIGHACGHNLIAEAGVAAGLGVKAALEKYLAPDKECRGCKSKALHGTITVLGTPAEETLGGKLNLIQNGAFDSIDAAMMVHPAPANIISPVFLAMSMWEITYKGRPAHAAAYPWEGVNALDAAVLAYNYISALRQQMRPSWRVHGVALSGGGSDPAIIPSQTSLLYYMRTPHKDELITLEEKVFDCFKAAAEATGCSVEIKLHAPKFDHLKSNEYLASLYAENLRSISGKEIFEMKQDMSISTDFGNVSQLLPSIHPMYRISNCNEVNHTTEFASACGTSLAHHNTLTVAKAMAHTCIDILSNKELLAKMKAM